jgi:hypothetical protein
MIGIQSRTAQIGGYRASTTERRSHSVIDVRLGTQRIAEAESPATAEMIADWASSVASMPSDQAIQASNLIAAEADIHVLRWRCINMRPGRLIAQP